MISFGNHYLFFILHAVTSICTLYQTVRRDNCALVKDVIETCLQKILIERSVQGAIEYVSILSSS
jgi:hypothetical protein